LQWKLFRVVRANGLERIWPANLRQDRDFCRARIPAFRGLMKFLERLEEWLRFSWEIWADSLEFGHDSGQFAPLRNFNSPTSFPLLLVKQD
jgi:hypothetical protein